MQRSLDDLGTPLCDVLFCVLDIETTGSDRGTDLITELGAVKVRGGQCDGTFQTLVNPGRAIAPSVTVLTGITESMVVSAPRIEQVLPSLLEFIGDAVVVGHNVSFDVAFINAALLRSDRPRLTNTIIDTLPLARRLVRDEVPDCRLGTLASRFRLDHRPTHRALDDALATADLLHLLLERSATLGVLGLDDLLLLPRIGAHPQAGKLKLTNHLPRSPGVYLFHGAGDTVLYVGKATNLRHRVRTYFGGDERRKVGGLLRETQRISYVSTPDVLSAEVLELRYLHATMPRYNKVGTTWGKYRYVRLSIDELWPRLTVVTDPSPTGFHFGPLPSRAAAVAVIEAVESVIPIRRCATRITRSYSPAADRAPCTSAQLGLALCPCTGAVSAADYRNAVDSVIGALTTHPQPVMRALTDRIATLANERRYEEAAMVRDRAQAFATAHQRLRLIAQLRDAGTAVLSIDDVEIHVSNGVLIAARPPGQLVGDLPLCPPTVPPAPAPLPRHAADEVLCLARAVDRLAHRVRLLHCDGDWSWPRARVQPLTRLRAA